MHEDLQLQIRRHPGRLVGRQVRAYNLTVGVFVGKIAVQKLARIVRGKRASTHMAQIPVPVPISSTF